VTHRPFHNSSPPKPTTHYIHIGINQNLDTLVRFFLRLRDTGENKESQNDSQIHFGLRTKIKCLAFRIYTTVPAHFYPAVKILSYVPILFLPFAVFAEGPRDERYWGQWRGPLDTGVATKADPPEEWSETKNIKWKIPLVGHGTSSPIVWDDRLFLTASLPHGEEIDPPGGARQHFQGAGDEVPSASC
jgi:hypothetical protein